MTTALISHPECFLHDMGEGHPEQPARIQAIQKELESSGLDDDLHHFTAPLATIEQLNRVHGEEYINSIFQASPAVGMVSLDPDTWMNPFTLNAALRAAGAAVLAVDLVMSGEVKSVFCNVRPPGHHAERKTAMGFCFFNNIAVGVAHALEYHQLKRVAIVDFDVHHGNGTEDIFQDDDRVLFCSSFQNPFYPFSGAETKNPHIVNIPLSAGSTGEQFREAAKKYWFEKIRQFQPELIFISAGFDAYAEDDMSEIFLVEDDYAWITREIKKIADQVCQGRIVSMLEGGYELKGLGRCAAAHIRELLAAK
jgi:acetoin utilization deacetylase AcuC-like enzyme